jgi:hypothetical protein
MWFLGLFLLVTNLVSGINDVITSFGDFYQFSTKKVAVFFSLNVTINFRQKSSGILSQDHL